MPISNPHICPTDRESQIKPHGNPESEWAQPALGLIYVGILGAEVVILGTISLFHFDETYTVRELAGMGLVLVGTALAWT